MRLRGRHYLTGETIEFVCIDGRLAGNEHPQATSPGCEAEWIAPGFFDLQVNGAGGISFNSERLTTEQVGKAVRIIAEHGVTGMLPTLVTNEFSALEHALRTLTQARHEDEFIWRRVPGYHLEGPWISPLDGYRGAHPKSHVRIPDWSDFQRLQESARGLIKMVTLSPELPGAIEFIEKLSHSGVVVGIGHTSAVAEIISDAFNSGAKLSTHLGNALPELIHRHNNPIWCQLRHRETYASVIADGHHIPEDLFHTIIQAKTSERTLLVSDASSLAGLPPGQYRQWDHDVELTVDGRLNLAGTPYLAGSVRFIDHCVANAGRYINNLPAAIEMASIAPRELLGMKVPDLSVGSVAEFVMFEMGSENCFQVRRTIVD